ncbi:MAG: hypothetical protein ABIQ40_10555 [Bacteroidia bacterium]
MKRKFFLGKLKGKKAFSSSFTDARLAENEMPLTRSNCEICRKCNLPVLTEENTSDFFVKTDCNAVLYSM